MDHTDKEKSYTDDESDSDGSLSLDLGLNCEICEKSFTSFKCFLQHEKSINHYKKISQNKLEKKLSKNLEDEVSSSIDDMTLYPKAFTECDACKKEFSGPESYYQHLKSKFHHKKVARAKLLEKVTVEGKVDIGKLMEIHKQNKETLTELGASGYSPTVEDTGSEYDGLAETHQFECTDCGKVFTGIDPWHQHLASKTHEKTLKQKRLLKRVTSGAQSIGPEHSEAASLATEYLDPIEVDGDVLVCRLCHKSFSGPESAAAHLKSKGHAKKKELREFKIEMAAKRPHTKRSKSRDFKNENQVSEGPATTHYFEKSNPVIPNEIVADATIKDFSNPTLSRDSELKEKSHIKVTQTQDFSNENHAPVGQASNVEESELVSPYENVMDTATDKEDGIKTRAASGHSDMKENPSGDLENSINVIASKDAAVETENLSNAQKDNALLCYEKYKNYKKIMNEIEAEKKH